MSTPNDQPPQPVPHPRDDQDSWDVIDQGSWESFPASDPPSWGSSRAAPTNRTIAESNREVTGALRAARRRRLIYAGIASGVVALGALVAIGVLRNRHRDC